MTVYLLILSRFIKNVVVSVKNNNFFIGGGTSHRKQKEIELKKDKECDHIEDTTYRIDN